MYGTVTLVIALIAEALGVLAAKSPRLRYPSQIALAFATGFCACALPVSLGIGVR
jgi:hypothetical protein